MNQPGNDDILPRAQTPPSPSPSLPDYSNPQTAVNSPQLLPTSLSGIHTPPTPATPAWFGSNQLLRNGRQIADYFATRASTASSPEQDKWVISPSATVENLGNFKLDGSKANSFVEKGSSSDNGSHFDEKRSILSQPQLVALSNRDDTDHYGGWNRRLHFLTPIFLTLLMGLSMLYVALRIHYTLQNQAADGRINIPAWTFLASEAVIIIATILNAIFPVFFTWVDRQRPQLRVVGDVGLPTVDLLICTCGEDLVEILDTVRASLDIDWPVDRFRVIVCDDGRSDELQSSLEVMRQKGHRNLVYQRRPKVIPHHAKAGNLRAACDRTLILTAKEACWDGPGEILASLDADMIPSRALLRALVAPLVADKNTAFACAPQSFYNLDRTDMLCSDLRGFFGVIEKLKDAAGCAWLTGSGLVIRRSALDECGGWAVGTVAEDVLMSTILQGKGYHGAYVHEHLQHGTCPSSYDGHLRQRTRWLLGNCQIASKLNGFLYGEQVKKLTFWQRLCGLTFVISNYAQIIVGLSFVVFPFVLWYSGTLVPVTGPRQLKILVRVVFAQTVCLRMYEICWSRPTGLFVSRRDQMYAWYMVPYFALSLCKRSLGLGSGGFKASGSISDTLNERNKEKRAPLYRRVWFMLWDCQVWMHVVLIVAYVGAVVYACIRLFSNDHLTANEIVYQLLTRVLWVPLAWLSLVVAWMVPIVYTLFPPSMPDREELLDRDPVTQVARPKPSSIAKREPGYAMVGEIAQTIGGLWTLAIFILSFTNPQVFVAPPCWKLGFCPMPN